MNRADFRARILDAVNDPGAVFTTTTQANRSIAEALETLAEDVDAVKRTAFLQLEAGVTYYCTRAIGTDVMAPWRLWLPHQQRRLTAVTMSELDARQRNWQTSDGDPYSWFPLSWDWFGVWPRPSTSGNVLRVDYLAWPSTLEADTDEAELLESDTDAVVFYGAYEAWAKRWDAKKAVDAYAAFKKSVDVARGKQNIKGGTPVTGRDTSISFRSGVRG
jgi:hypothetical protein